MGISAGKPKGPFNIYLSGPFGLDVDAYVRGLAQEMGDSADHLTVPDGDKQKASFFGAMAREADGSTMRNAYQFHHDRMLEQHYKLAQSPPPRAPVRITSACALDEAKALGAASLQLSLLTPQEYTKLDYEAELLFNAVDAHLPVRRSLFVLLVPRRDIYEQRLLDRCDEQARAYYQTSLDCLVALYNSDHYVSKHFSLVAQVDELVSPAPAKLRMLAGAVLRRIEHLHRVRMWDTQAELRELVLRGQPPEASMLRLVDL